MEVLDLLKGFKFVYIMCDCCFSGKWAYEADELSNNGTLNQLQIQTLIIHCASSADRKASWGEYRKLMKLEGQEKAQE